MATFRLTLFAVALTICAAVISPALQAQTSESKAERDLKELVATQQRLLARAARAEHQIEIEDLRPQLQQLVFDYEQYLRNYPNQIAGYVSYALLLGNPLIDERKRASALLLKVNEMNADLPIVKNQLGKYLAEDGKPLEALNYFLAAVQLEPKEPLYHFQVAQLLSAAREDFVKSGEWTAEQIETAMRNGFEQAMVLAPDNIAYAYRWAESFYDLEHPEWDEALETWRALESRVSTPIERETVRLHQANILIQQQKMEEARRVLDTVNQEVLQGQKQTLLAKLTESAGGAGSE